MAIDSEATLRLTYYNDAYSGSTNATNACQGFHSAGPSSRIGLIYFNNLKDTLRTKKIKQITLTLSININGGDGTRPRQIRFCRSKPNSEQYINTVNTGGIYGSHFIDLGVNNGLGEELGVLTCSEVTSNDSKLKTFQLNSASNKSLFDNFTACLEAGDTLFVLYNGQNKDDTGYGYSKDYLVVESASISVDCVSYDPLYLCDEAGLSKYDICIYNGTSWDLYVPCIATADGYAVG